MCPRVSPENGSVRGSVRGVSGVLRGRGSGVSKNCPRASLECQTVPDTLGTFCWTLWIPGPSGPWRHAVGHSLEHPVFGRHLRDTSGLKDPRDSCNQVGSVATIAMPSDTQQYLLSFLSCSGMTSGCQAQPFSEICGGFWCLVCVVDFVVEFFMDFRGHLQKRGGKIHPQIPRFSRN